MARYLAGTRRWHLRRGVATCVGLVLILGLLISPSGMSGAANGHRLTSTVSSQMTSQQPVVMDQAYGNLPLAFEINTGQADSTVRFLAHGSGYTLFLGTQQMTLALSGSRPGAVTMGKPVPAAPSSLLGVPGPQAQVDGASLQMTWVGGNPYPQVSGEDALPGVVNYFIGNDPAAWRTHVATYAHVRYRGIYPGIDLVYYGSQDGLLEYDFLVRPGANPGQIALAFGGAAGLSVDDQGALQLQLANGQSLEQPAPTIYQPVNGTQKSVSGRYRIDASGRVSFALGAYDHALPLVIDPLYRYVTYLGGSSADFATGIAVDSSGAAYVTGNTTSTDFPLGGGAFQGSNAGGNDAFVTKLNPSGTSLVYSTYLGGSGDDFPSGIAVDSSGNAYITGQTSSTNFPTSVGAPQTTAGGGGDAFVAKLNATGASLVYSTYLGGSSFDNATRIALDAMGNAYVAGSTSSTDFPVAGAAFQGSSAGGGDAFVTKLNASGTSLVYSMYLGGSGSDGASGIAVDSAGNAYITGSTSSTDFPTSNPYQGAYAGNTDAFVTKLNAAGAALLYSTYLGGSSEDDAFGLAVDGSGNAYVTGHTFSANFPVTTSSFSGARDAFVTKLNAAGSALAYSTYLGGSGIDAGNGIAVDALGYAYIVGYTNSRDFPVASPLQGSLSGTEDAFVARLSPTADLLFSTYLGGSGNEEGVGLAVTIGGNVYVAGWTPSTDFPHPNALYPMNAGSVDAFVAKLNTLPTPIATAGLYNPAKATFYLRHENAPGYANITVTFGPANTCKPVVGDWTGKGYKSLGLFCAGAFYLRNSNSAGPADIAFNFGAAGWSPIAGDWTGKGYDSIGLYNPTTSTFYLKNSNAGGAADITFTFGRAGAGWLPVAGDWNGKGFDSVGLYNPTNHVFYLRNANSGGNASITAYFGGTGDLPLVGDWTRKGYDSIGVFDPPSATIYLSNLNASGFADISFAYGTSSMQPIAGQWVLAPGSTAVHRNPSKKP